MIISASRRTDIPRYYGEWFIRRVRAGYCIVANPFFPEKQYRVSLQREDVDCFVFWTRCPESLLPYLNELGALGYPYYFLYTVVDYPKVLEPGSQSLEKTADVFRTLAGRIGAERTVWRYDPIYLSGETDFTYHLERFRSIAEKLAGYTKRVIISFYDSYRKTESRLQKLPPDLRPLPDRTDLSFISDLADTAVSAGMEIQSCAEKHDLTKAGVPPGACIDSALMHRLFGIRATERKDPSQRTLCRCVQSRDIGAYGTCPGGCLYCYATESPEGAKTRHAQHDPAAASLV